MALAIDHKMKRYSSHLFFGLRACQNKRQQGDRLSAAPHIDSAVDYHLYVLCPEL